MSVLDNDALICDFAQYYNIYKLEDYEISLRAVLACGLPEDSRIKKRLKNFNYSLVETLIAACVDHLALVLFQNSKRQSIKKPKSLLNMMYGHEEESNIQNFATPEDFERARQQILES